MHPLPVLFVFICKISVPYIHGGKWLRTANTIRHIEVHMNNGLTKNQNRAASTWMPSERVQRLLTDHNSSPSSLGAERAIHYTEFDKKEASKYPSAHIRRAKSLAYHLQNRTIHIYDDEIIVGSHTEHRIGAICLVELAVNVML